MLYAVCRKPDEFVEANDNSELYICSPVRACVPQKKEKIKMSSSEGQFDVVSSMFDVLDHLIHETLACTVPSCWFVYCMYMNLMTPMQTTLSVQSCLPL